MQALSCTVCEAGLVVGPSARQLRYRIERAVGQGAYGSPSFTQIFFRQIINFYNGHSTIGVVWSATCLEDAGLPTNRGQV